VAGVGLLCAYRRCVGIYGWTVVGSVAAVVAAAVAIIELVRRGRKKAPAPVGENVVQAAADPSGPSPPRSDTEIPGQRRAIEEQVGLASASRDVSTQSRPTADWDRKSLTVISAIGGFLLIIVVVVVVRPLTSSSSAIPSWCTPDGPLVLAVSGRQDSPAPALTSCMRAAVTKASKDASSIGLISVDGRPYMVPVPSQPGSDSTSWQRAIYIKLISAEVSRVRAQKSHANVLDALFLAGRALRSTFSHGTIFLEDSGLQEAGNLNFRTPGLLQTKPSELVARLAREGELPNLKGETVVLVGIGDTAPPQGQLSNSQQAKLVGIWSAIAKASGATVHVDPTPREGPAPVRVPPVDLVPVSSQLYPLGCGLDGSEGTDRSQAPRSNRELKA
jgi:hypothetical protein